MARIIQIYANTTPADNVASILVRANSFLEAISWHLQAAASGADFTLLAMLSQQSTSSPDVLNDIDNVISYCKIGGDLTTSGGLRTSENHEVVFPGRGLQFQQLDRIYMHYAGTAIVLSTHALLFFSA